MAGGTGVDSVAETEATDGAKAPEAGTKVPKQRQLQVGSQPEP